MALIDSASKDGKQAKETGCGSELKQRYGLVLLYTRRLGREKRIEVILRAMPSVVERLDTQLVVAGPGKVRSESDHVFVIAGVAELQSVVTQPR